jgi:lambda family phage tail tape measure protein
MAQIGSLSVKLGLVTVEWDKATADAKRSAKDLQAQFNALGTRVKGLADDFKNAGIAAITIGMGALYHQAVALSDEVTDLSHSFGLSIPEVLAFRDALQSSGGKAENADKAISTLFGKIADAKSGNDAAIAQFERLGISFTELKTLSPYDAIVKVANGFKSITDQFERTKAIKDVFSKAGIGVSMDDLSAALAKGTGGFDKYANSLETVGQVSDALKTNLQNLTIAFADLIAPFSKTHILTVQEFSNILKGVGAAATVLGIAAVAREMLNVASAIRAAAAAGALFNLTAGGATPIGLILKAVTTLAAIGTFIYVSGSAEEPKGAPTKSTDRWAEMGQETFKKPSEVLAAKNARENQWSDAKFKPLPDSSDARFARPDLKLGEAPAEKIAEAVSKEASAKQKTAALTRELMMIDIKRAEVNLDILRIDNLDSKLALIDLDTQQKILEINSKVAQEKAAAGDKETAALSAARNAAAGAEVARIKQAAADSKALAAIQNKIDLDKKAFENQQVYLQSLGQTGAEDEQETAKQRRDAEDARRIAIFGLSNQQKESVRLNDLSNERLAYENTLLLTRSDERDLLMQQYDLEGRILDYKRQAQALGTPQGTIDAYEASLRATGQATIKISKEGKDAQKTFAYGWDKAFNDYKEAAFNAAAEGGQAFQTFSKGMESAIDSFVETGKISFASLTESIIKDLLKIALRKQMLNLMDMSTGGVGTLISAGMKFFGFADGGDPPVGVPSMVGERGPELFIPKTAGTIVPNNMLRGNDTGPTINYNGPYIANLSAIDTQSGAAFLAKNKQAVWATYQSANRSIPMSR